MKNRKLFISGLALCLSAASCSNGGDSSNAIESSVPYADVCSLFRLPSGTESIFCIDKVNGNSFDSNICHSIYADEGSDVDLSGWALDAVKRDSYSAVYAIVGENVFKGNINAERPDVQALYGTPNALVGFSITIPAAALNDISTFELVFVGADFSYSSVPLTFTISSKNGLSQKSAQKLFSLPMKKTVRTDWFGGFIIDANNGAEYVFGQPIKLNADGGIMVSGCAFDIDDLEPISMIYAVVGDKVYPFLPFGDRADVRAVFGMTKVADLAFTINLPADAIKDQSSISFIMVSADGSHRYASRQYAIAK